MRASSCPQLGSSVHNRTVLAYRLNESGQEPIGTAQAWPLRFIAQLANRIFGMDWKSDFSYCIDNWTGCQRLGGSVRDAGDKPGGNRFRLCNGRAHDYGEDAEIEGAADFVRLADVTFNDDGEMHGLDQLLY